MKTTSMHYLSQFLRVSVLGMAHLDASGSGFLCNHSQAAGWGFSYLKARLGWEMGFWCSSCGCWWEASAPLHVGCSVGLLWTRQMASHRVSDEGVGRGGTEREKERMCKMEAVSFIHHLRNDISSLLPYSVGHRGQPQCNGRWAHWGHLRDTMTLLELPRSF